ncbi:hypothetical protein J6J34_08135 [Pseudidiomarina sp. 1ASP75-14]|uniref:hypothetical protein n=1 Tax=Pseudidiomarina terrestris TaxID=2820060 RepID=UPI002655D4A7|nr:hypothetical protein [Pseudidiomarina sp. 1ASP75-14]MDN7138178.1 hypothetical protein [Pseudidiomarina sp. 1ASP75-14]
MRIWGALLSFILFCIAGFILGYQMTRIYGLENELRRYVIAVEIQQRLHNNEIASASSLLQKTLESQYEIIEALAETNPDMYQYYRELMSRSDPTDDNKVKE